MRSATAGGFAGVFLRVTPGARVIFESAAGRAAFTPADTTPDPRVLLRGAFTETLACSRCAPGARPRDLAFTWELPAPPPGRRSFFVRVCQRDGHMAWSSPIFVTFRD